MTTIASVIINIIALIFCVWCLLDTKKRCGSWGNFGRYLVVLPALIVALPLIIFTVVVGRVLLVIHERIGDDTDTAATRAFYRFGDAFFDVVEPALEPFVRMARWCGLVA